MNGQITFNAVSWQSYNPSTGVGIITEEIIPDFPDTIINLMPVANANKSAIPGEPDSPSKTILVKGTIVGSSVTDLAQRTDQFKLNLNGKNRNLDLGYAGSTRRYIATHNPNGSSIVEKAKKRYAPFTIQLICTEPFGMDVTATTLINQTGYTSASLTVTPTVGGTAPYQLPIFTITINSLTGTGDYVQISNNANNQAMLIAGQGIEAGDVLVIDCEKRTVYLNDVEIDYTGASLELEPGASSLTYSDGFTTRNVDIHAEYYKRYS